MGSDFFEWAPSKSCFRWYSIVRGDCYKWSSPRISVGSYFICDVHKWFIRSNLRLLQVNLEWEQNFEDGWRWLRVVEDDSIDDTLQRDIDSVTNWTKEWLMKLNSNKCRVMHFGNKNARYDYSLDDLSTGQRISLEVSECERDLGVFVSSDFKWLIHVLNISLKTNKISGMLVKNFTCRDVDLWKQLDISLLRPHLEWVSSVLNPYRQGDISILKKVQKISKG